MITYFFTIIGMICLAVFLCFRDKKGSIKALLFKSLTSACFIAVGVSAMISNPDIKIYAKPMALFMMGLTLGLIGDILLDLKIYVRNLGYANAQKDSDMLTFGGMIAFGIGHVCYILSEVFRAPGGEMNLLWSALASLALTAIIFVISIKVLKMEFGKFLVPSIIYGFLLVWFVTLVLFNIAFYDTNQASSVLIIAAPVFLLSDLVLSMTYFSKKEDYAKKGPLNPESRLMISVNHILYYVAQFLIAISIMYM